VLHSWCWIAAELRQSKDSHIIKAILQTPHQSILFYIEGGAGQQYSDQYMDRMTAKSQSYLL